MVHTGGFHLGDTHYMVCLQSKINKRQQNQCESRGGVSEAGALLFCCEACRTGCCYLWILPICWDFGCALVHPALRDFWGSELRSSCLLHRHLSYWATAWPLTLGFVDTLVNRQDQTTERILILYPAWKYSLGAYDNSRSTALYLFLYPLLPVTSTESCLSLLVAND